MNEVEDDKFETASEYLNERFMSIKEGVSNIYHNPISIAKETNFESVEEAREALESVRSGRVPMDTKSLRQKKKERPIKKYIDLMETDVSVYVDNVEEAIDNIEALTGEELPEDEIPFEYAFEAKKKAEEIIRENPKKQLENSSDWVKEKLEEWEEGD